jgi:CheY-like chemotaxis protein/Tfp pilus assembly protein PilZ
VHREQRIVIRCEVEFDRLGRRIQTVSEDLSSSGIFVRTEELLAVGAVVELCIRLPDGPEFRVVSRVAHLLTPAAARSLGRRPGMGFAFLAHENAGRERLLAYLQELTEDMPPPPLELPNQPFAVVADPRQPLLDRLENALGSMGFETLLFRNGAEALAACHELIPDVVVAALDMPVMNGLALLARLKHKPVLADVPVVLLADEATDLTRLQAYRLGVRDVIPRPFTDEELCIRVGRAALEARRRAPEPVLRGNLSEISVATLLSLFEFERRSGVLHLHRDDEAASLYVSGGRVVRASARDPEPGPMALVMRLLDWKRGRFEWSPCEVVAAGDDLGLQTQQLLLEHARVTDEATAGRGEPPRSA